ncbi:hypothetical protein V3C99_012384 [Haemonchus contortus]
MNIFGYLSGFILGCIAYCKSLYLVESREQKMRIRYVLMVSALSIVLVSIPNGISLFAQYIAEVADAIAKPSTYLACASSSINIFVYLALNREFRTEFKRIILRRGGLAPTHSRTPVTISVVTRISNAAHSYKRPTIK